MGLESDTMPDATGTTDDGATSTPAPDGTKPPISADERARAAERARKSRALKKLKAAKTEQQLKEVAAEVAKADEPERAPSWPSGEEIGKAAAQLATAIEQGAELLTDTPFALTPKKQQLLLMTCAPAIAQTSKNPGESALARIISPGIVAVVGLAVVFGPPLVREVRAMVNGDTVVPEAPKP